ncbi:ATP-binding protein [Phenylobacterium immobile]|uniref:ATP-binding protein n=1 Tax=Phenylobacterium immobile TaxID=21 RepID=UPI000AF6FAC2|nr:ATP-binding protein [Phenylobacterium immobile]
MHVTLWPKGLVGRVTAVILAAVLLQFVGSILLQDQLGRYTLRADHARRVAELLVVGERLLADAEPDRRADVLNTLTTEHLTAVLRDTPPIIKSQDDPVFARLRTQIIAWEPSLADNALRLGSAPGRQGRADLVGAMSLSDGKWLEFRSRDLFGHWPQLYRTIGSAAILTLGVLAAAGMLVRTLAAPLRNLANAADRVGHGAPVTVLEEGPGDLRRVAKAFNAMQARIGRLIADRTEALAAVGHDLRTPLSRMRLRAGLIPDPDAREAMEGDIAEMDALLASIFAYMSGDTDGAPPRKIDLAALISTLVDANADVGRPVRFEGLERLFIVARPLPLKRALSNLVENGLKYGQSVQVRLEQTATHARILVEDDGPGVPEDKLLAVTAPFYRLDEARARDGSGMGLGLAIVVQAVERENGEFRLSNRPEGGLRAEILLPLGPRDT